MASREIPAVPPRLTLTVASFLPSSLRHLACGGIHTIPSDYGHCAVCDKDWTKGRHWLRFHGTRAPLRRGSFDRGTTLKLEVTPSLTLYRVNGRWNVRWRYHNEEHSSSLLPAVSFSHRNITRQIEMERRERERETWAEEPEEAL